MDKMPTCKWEKNVTNKHIFWKPERYKNTSYTNKHMVEITYEAYAYIIVWTEEVYVGFNLVFSSFYRVLEYSRAK